VRLRVVVWHPHAGWQRDVEVQNIGFGGACVHVADPLALRDDVTLSFVAPSLWDPLAMPGRVAWISPATHVEGARAGIAFLPKEAHGMLALFELLAGLTY
jgi:hypothetical protein